MRLLLAVMLFARVASAESSPTIDVVTMGAGDSLFSAFGHAAICVRDERSPAGRCYNYGTADFSTPLPLTWDFVRGRARFWVAVWDERQMLAAYAREDRTVWRQRLDIGPDRARELAAALEASTDEKVRYYQYHHFRDNCTTRIRDLVDHASGGTLSRDPRDRHHSFRDYAKAGFAGNWPLLVVVDLLLGRPADEPTRDWEAMFLPDVLREEVARRFDATASAAVARRRPLPAAGSTALGTLAFALGGLGLSLLAFGGARWGGRARALALLPSGLVLGLAGLIVWSLALLSSFPELRWNENLLVFWPTDAALPFWSAGRAARYARVRVLVLAALALLHLGLLRQPLGPLVLAVLPLGAVWLARPRTL